MRAIVVGAGVAGPVMAMALQKAGIEAEVVEARPPADVDVGSYFTVSPNGLDALASVDALSVAKAIGFPTRTNELCNDAGVRLGTVGLGAPLADGTPALTMKRSRFARALADEAGRRGLPVHHGRRLVAIDDRDGAPVVVRFDDGSSREADLVIGADGVHSSVRRSIDPNAPAPRFVGLTNFGGVTPAGVVPTDVAPETWRMIFGRRAFFGYHATPTGELVWFVNLPRRAIAPDERASTSDASWLAHLVSLFEDEPNEAAAILRAGRLELAADNTHDLGHVPTWWRGRRIVIGDAAHAPAPSSGQGASMALEDAVVLARCLRDRPTITEAFTTYETLRRERVEAIVAQGARSSSSKTPGVVGRFFRDLAMRMVFRYVVTDASVAWMYDHRIPWHEPVTGD